MLSRTRRIVEALQIAALKLKASELILWQEHGVQPIKAVHHAQVEALQGCGDLTPGDWNRAAHLMHSEAGQERQPAET